MEGKNHNIMKKILIITLLIIYSLSLKADMWEPNPIRKAFVYGWFIGIPVTVAYAHYWHERDRNIAGMYLSPSIDVKMILTEGLDYRAKYFSSFGRIETGLTFEQFPKMDYAGLGMDINYLIIDRKLSLLSGLELTRIWNENKAVWSKGMNIEIRYLAGCRFSLSYIANFKTRPELSESKPDVLMSGYIQLNYRIISYKNGRSRLH